MFKTRARYDRIRSLTLPAGRAVEARPSPRLVYHRLLPSDRLSPVTDLVRSKAKTVAFWYGMAAHFWQRWEVGSAATRATRSTASASWLSDRKTEGIAAAGAASRKSPHRLQGRHLAETSAS